MAEATAESQNAILPEDLIIEILSRVEPSVYLQLRCVCKWWKSLVFDHYLLEKHIRISITEIMYLVCDAVKRLKSSELLRKEEDLDGEEEEEENEEDFDDEEEEEEVDDEEDFDEEEDDDYDDDDDEDDEEDFDDDEDNGGGSEEEKEEDFDDEEEDEEDDDEEDFDEEEVDDEEDVEEDFDEEDDDDEDDEEDFDEEEDNAEEDNIDEENGGGSEEEKESAWKVVIEFLRQKEAVPLDNFLKILRGIKEQYESIRDEMQIAEDRVKCLQNILQVRLSQVMNEALSNSFGPSPLSTNFLFGTASSAYQYEGAYLSDGKGLSDWDVLTHKTPDKIKDGSNGDIAVDQYHRYLEDIDLMEAMKVNSYRFSISWARVLPKGRFGEVNSGGINYYNRLIDALLLKGIQPFVTLSHFDLPQELGDRYGGWLSPESQEDFVYLADLCFKSFGDRVKYWATFNEPDYLITYGYRKGIAPPFRCSKPFGNCSEGDSEKEPYLAAHNIILSHAAAAYIYRTKYQAEQGGKIGIVLHFDWYEPISNSMADKMATERARSFTNNWLLDPIIFGEYPPVMQKILGDILPKFSNNNKEKLKSGLDFIGINHYASYYIKDCIYSKCEPGPGITRTEGLFQQSAEKDGVPIGKPTSIDWQYVYPQGMEKIVTYLKNRYNNTPMFITENGYGELDNPNNTEEQYLNDFDRKNYMAGHLYSLLEAIRKGADVRGYFAWSLLDNFEWLQGYTVRFGLHHVDYATLKRTPRLSANWYKEFIANHKTEVFRQEK